ncbi:MAG: hypothetical protein HY547_08355 [Elusimicrobia bacterium]|nr:hypothetical protein [Elusimicrobiota bacterium]
MGKAKEQAAVETAKNKKTPVQDLTVENSNAHAMVQDASTAPLSALNLPSSDAQVFAAPPQTETPTVIYGPQKSPYLHSSADQGNQTTNQEKDIMTIMERDARKKQLFRSMLGSFDIGSPERKVGQGVYVNTQRREAYE